MLREWHRASLLGCELERVEVDGKPLGREVVLMLNLWISAGSAWNASRQDYFEAWARLDRVVNGPAPGVKPPGGRGRRRRDGRASL